jgi:hypothetical protein
MKDLALGSGTHDLYLEGGDWVIIEEENEVAQSTEIRLLFIEAEWLFDYTLGVPWFDYMFATSSSLEQKEQILKSTIQNTIGISQITEFVFGVDPINKGALVTFSATVETGEEIDVTVVSP